MKKEFIKLAGILCAITLIAALILACVNKITAPEIAKASQKASEEAMNTILPADKYEMVEGRENVSKAIKGNDVIGYCVTVTVNGFGGPIEMMVGIGTNGVLAGVDILSHSETAGLGAKADTDEFKQRFVRKNPDLTVVKEPTTDIAEVQAITGATITSRAVAEGVKQANEIVKEIEGGDK